MTSVPSLGDDRLNPVSKVRRVISGLTGLFLEPFFNRFPANVPEKKAQKEAKTIIMGYVTDLAQVK